MIPRLVATQFNRFLETGRTGPGIFRCEAASELEEQIRGGAGEYVVKLRGGIDTRESGLMRELVGSLLAAWFGIETPTPATVLIEPALAELIAAIQPSRAALIRESTCLNFGSRLLSDGYSPWPVEKSIPDSMRPKALDIFAFDALIQNPDRRYSNQNLLTRGDTIMVFDHETAFSFLLDIRPSAAPWKLAGQNWLEDHVFFRRLRARPFDLNPFTERLEALSDVVLGGILDAVPVEWKNSSLSIVQKHLAAMRGHAREFAVEIERILA